ncbi:MAG: putative bifunctional diguanylate cyclase/phosphodiesterase [Phormidesmis sp.]
MKLPEVVTSYLVEKMIADKSASCIHVTTAGQFISAEGELAKYGLSNIEKDEFLGDRLAFLQAFFPLSLHPEALPQVHISSDLIIDIHLIPNNPSSRFAPQALLASPLDGGWVLILDTTAETKKQQQLQQQSNELSLLRHQTRKQQSPGTNLATTSTTPSAAASHPENPQPTAEEALSIPQQSSVLEHVATDYAALTSPTALKDQDGPLLSHLLATLNLLVLERHDTTPSAPTPNSNAINHKSNHSTHTLSVIGQLPPWAIHRFDCFQPPENETTASDCVITAEAFSPFLDNFLYDADAFWQAAKPSPYLRSGIWSETDTREQEIHLEAIALSIGNRNIILIESLNTANNDKFQWLQTARQEQLNFIAERKAATSQIRQATSYDQLTGLPNRSLFLSELETLFEASQWSNTNPFALVILNLDRFQLLNNSLGTEIGDQVLIAVADRIRECLREFDIPVRLSSDEFAIVLGQITGEHTATAIAQRILTSINAPFIINGSKTYFTASVGIALSAPWYRHSRDLLRDANIAMQEAKRKHRGSYVVFDRDMRIRAFERWSLESALDTAIEKNQLELFYQPIVSLNNNRVKGFEALIRWQHPQKGFISPVHFIPLAEESGHILSIDDWVLHEACRTIQQWQQRTGNSTYLNINVSPQHFEKGDLFETVQSAIQKAHIPPESICLEITESCLLTDTQAVVSTLNQIKALGVQIAIDDFGTGYASLGYLQDLPLDKLKIDGYFIEMMKSNGSDIVNTVVELAHRLNFNVTAERVETVEQYQTLQQLGCDMGQGYLFSKPLPSDEAQSFINAQVVVPKQTFR